MPRKDPRVDAYIAAAPPFARPILKALRRRVHESVPRAEETIRWGSPFFQYGGKLLCGMSAFKAHCNFGARGVRRVQLLRPQGVREMDRGGEARRDASAARREDRRASGGRQEALLAVRTPRRDQPARNPLVASHAGLKRRWK